MRLADFIEHDMERILAQWEAFATTRLHAKGMTSLALRDHAKEILQAIARDLRTAQTREEQVEKSKGLAPNDPTAPETAAPTASALSLELAQQLQPMVHDLTALRQTVEQLKVRQEQSVRENENLASQLKASREEMARNNGIIDQIKATQIQMARESQTLTERLNASQEQLARVIANASEPKATPEAPKVMPQIPLPRPRQSANVVQTQKPARIPAPPQAKKPQPSLAWPWSVR